MQEVTATFLDEITVFDPETGEATEVEMWKDPISGGIFGVDSAFLDNDVEKIVSPFDSRRILVLPYEEIE